MADPLCTSKSITKFPLFIQHYIPSKPFLSLPKFSFHHPNFSKKTRNRGKKLHFTCLCTPNLPNFDIISTHEHSDGSLVFRFGDPSEVVKNDKLLENNVESEEIEDEEIKDFNVVKVLDGDHKREVIVKKIDGEVKSNGLIEVVDEAYSVAVSSESNSVGEKESSSSEILSSSSIKDEMPTSISSIELNDSSLSISKDEDAVLVEESIEMNDSSESIVEEDGIPVEMDGVETSNVSREILSSSSIDVEMPVSVASIELNDSYQSIVEFEDAVDVEENSIEKDEDKDESSPALNLPSLSHISELESNAAPLETLEPIVDSNCFLESVSVKLEPVVEVLGDDLQKETTQENAKVVHSSTPANAVNVEAGSENEISGESDVIETMPLSLPSEAEPILEVEDAVDVEESSIEKDEEKDESSAALNTGHISELESNGAPLETLEPIVDSNSFLKSVSVKLEPVVEVLGDDVQKEMTQEKVKVVHSSTPADALNVEAGIEHEIGGESDVIEMMPLSLPSEAEPILDEEANIDTIKESSELDRSEDAITIKNSSESVLELERTGAVVESDKLVDASSGEVLELKSTSEEIPVPKLIFSSGASLLPHPDKALTGGEDAYFTFKNWLGVADGVGQWSLEGVEPGVYTKELMENCREIVSNCNDVPITAPEEVLNIAVAKAHSPGSSTVLVAHFDGQALHVANIGDSGFIILRNAAVHQRSSPMLHELNFPVQIERGDDPTELIESYTADLDEGDVVLIATDGLFDNLYEQEIMSIIMKSLETDKNPQEIAEILAMRAIEKGSSTSTRTPFADAAQAAGYLYTGGKVDDVAVIVSLVEKVPDARPL